MARQANAEVSLLFLSFGYKHGIPVDADLVFDVRCLPNPYWKQELRAWTGRDQPVIEFLDAEPEVQAMLEDKDFTMINVHIPWQGDIPQTDLRLAYDQIEKNFDQLPQEKDAKFLVYCLTSDMAKMAIST